MYGGYLYGMHTCGTELLPMAIVSVSITLIEH